MEDDNSETPIPVTVVVEDLSIERPSPSEKSHDVEKLSEVIEPSDFCQISIDNEVIRN